MYEWIDERERKLREFFELGPEVGLLSPDAAATFNVPDSMEAHLTRFNMEWHVIPSENAIHVSDNAYRARLYPMLKRELKRAEYQQTSHYQALMHGHQRHQGRILGVETTQKPTYLPGNRQFYGTHYGFEPAADPFAAYMGRAGFTTGTRYGHNYSSLRKFVNTINEEWQKQSLMPQGYRLTLCPPIIFNLIGTIFHREWSETESLELGFYRDERGNAHCYAVGSNAPGDFSHIHGIETESDWTLLGFRMALVSE